MRKTPKVLLIIWNIILLPCVMIVISELTSWESLGAFAFWTPLFMLELLLVAVTQDFFLPQIICAVVIALYIAEMVRAQDIHPIKKELPSLIPLTVWTVASGICAFVAMLILSESPGPM